MAKKILSTNYPISICFIIVNEFCERFSYYGMKAVLTLYFVSYLHWDTDLSTAIYHAFSSLCYFTPILGALIADSWLGKFKTIIYLSIVYVIGHIIKSVGAIPTVGDTNVHIALSMSGLILIALGTGGIKPCVSAFGGDQFGKEHVTERLKFFSVFYMSINAGSLLSTIITPILRGDVKCFGDDCYALAFGVPAILMIVALVVFIAGSSMYKKNPPQGNILVEVCSCIGFAIRNRLTRWRYEPRRRHWLDWAEGRYSKRLIQEIKMVLRVLFLFIPLPMFWALFDQQGSRWTLQSTRMNMAITDSFAIKPDQMQMLNPLLILLFVPVFDLIIYPLVAFCRIKITPLRKMSGGMVVAALAFAVATLVEVNVVKSVVDPAPAGRCLLQVYNVAGDNVTMKLSNSSLFPEPIRNLQDPPRYETLVLDGPSRPLQVEVTFRGKMSLCNLTFQEKEAYSLILHKDVNVNSIQCKLETDYVHKSDAGKPFIRFLNTQPEALVVTVGGEVFSLEPGYSLTKNKTVNHGNYPSALCRSTLCSNLTLGRLDFGASYTFVLLQESGTTTVSRMVDVAANDVHIAWQIPQYVLITMGEVMFSITGLEFSYSQAPSNMKSVLQAGWLLTVAFGNVIVLIVAEGAALEQWKEFILFSGLLLIVFIIFSIMAHFYTYVDPEELDRISREEESGKKDEDDLMKMKEHDPEQNETGKQTRL